MARRNPWWVAFAVVYFVLWLGVSMYWVLAQTGPLGWVARWEAGLFDGSWYPKTTVLIVLGIGLLPLLVIKLAIERVLGRRLTPPLR